jgi:hypothetical protein
MGRCDHVSASIGLRIRLSDLILQINEDNDDLIREMVEEGCIEDENDYFNEVFEAIRQDLPSTDMKAYLTHECTTRGTYQKSRDGRVVPTLKHGSLWDQWLLVPVKVMVSMERWGHDREGQNGVSTPLDLSAVPLERYRAIEHASTVCILRLRTG